MHSDPNNGEKESFDGSLDDLTAEEWAELERATDPANDYEPSLAGESGLSGAESGDVIAPVTATHSDHGGVTADADINIEAEAQSGLGSAVESDSDADAESPAGQDSKRAGVSADADTNIEAEAQSGLGGAVESEDASGNETDADAESAAGGSVDIDPVTPDEPDLDVVGAVESDSGTEGDAGTGGDTESPTGQDSERASASVDGGGTGNEAHDESAAGTQSEADDLRVATADVVPGDSSAVVAPQSDLDTGNETDAGAEPAAGAGVDIDPVAPLEAGSDLRGAVEPDSDLDSGADSGAGTGSDADSPVGLDSDRAGATVDADPVIPAEAGLGVGGAVASDSDLDSGNVVDLDTATADPDTAPHDDATDDAGAAEGPPRMPLPRIIAVANQKGGVGKTTTTVNVAACLAEQGYRTLLIDLDPQANASTGLGLEPRELEHSIYHVMLHDEEPDSCIEPTEVKNLFVLPSSLDLAGAEIELVPMLSREHRLRLAIESVIDDYDYVLIDCPPSLGLLTINALTAAHEVLVPIQCEYYALEGLGQLMQNVDLIRASLNPTLQISHIVLVMFDPRTKLAGQVVDEVRSHFGSTVCDNVIPRTVRLSEAPSFGQPITTFDSHSRGAAAYRAVTQEVLNGQA